MPRRVDHDERRTHITAALLRIAGTQGLQAVTMREVAAEAGISLRLVQYYAGDKPALLRLGLDELAARLDRRIRERAAARGTGLAPRAVVEVVLTSILPIDEASRLDRMAWSAYFAVALTEPALLGGATNHPDALENWLTTVLARAQDSGDIDPDQDPRTEVAALLALTNGLSDSVVGGQRDAGAALAILGYQLDRVFGRAIPEGARGGHG
jgi:AcrR family transcriptional regulator